MDNVHRSITPGDLRAHRRFSFSDHHRNTVDDIHQIQTFSTFFALAREFPLVSDDTLIFGWLTAEKANVKIIAIFPEGSDAPETVLDVFVFILPETDRSMLKEGFIVDERSIGSVIEDYTG